MLGRIAEIQSLGDTLKDKLLNDAIDELNHEMRRLYGKLRRRLLHLYRNFASHLLKQPHELGVSTIYLGYPFNIAQNKGSIQKQRILALTFVAVNVADAIYFFYVRGTSAHKPMKNNLYRCHKEKYR